MVASWESFLPLLVLAGLLTGALAGGGAGTGVDPDCPDGRPEGDLDPDHPCAHLGSSSRTETGSPELPALVPGEERTFECMRWGGCALFHVETPVDGARRMHIVVEAEMAGGFSPRASMLPGPHFEPMWADGAYYDGGERTEWTFEAPFAATDWVLEFTSMWEDDGGDVTVVVDFV